MRHALLPVLALLAACGSPDPSPADSDTADSDGPDPDARPWTRVETVPVVDVRTDRLCDPVDESAPGFDPGAITCRVDTFRFAPDTVPAPTGPLTVMAFNIERGLKLDALLAAFDAGDLPVPDLWLASELDRGCSRTQGRDVTREIAEKLSMDAVFGVEFVELARGTGAGGTIDAPCEHGNAIFSRYPLGNVENRFHDQNLTWYLPPDDRDDGEPRLGGRSFVVGDARVGDRLVRLVSLHFESSPQSWQGIQASQAAEAADAGLEPGGPALVGGDTNFPGYTFDLNRNDGRIADAGATEILDRGLVDAHAALDPAERGTSSGLVIDLIFGSDVTFTNPAVCTRALCDTLSDHQAVWAEVTLDP